MPQLTYYPAKITKMAYLGTLYPPHYWADESGAEFHPSDEEMPMDEWPADYSFDEVMNSVFTKLTQRFDGGIWMRPTSSAIESYEFYAQI